MTQNARLYNIPEDHIAEMTAKFAKLNKRAVKLGVEQFSFEVVGEHKEFQIETECFDGPAVRTWTQVPADAKPEAYSRATGRVRLVKHVRLLGAQQIKLAGYVFVAVLDHDLGEENTVIRPAPDAGDLPVKFRTSGAVCEHCNHDRRRKQTYVVRHEETGAYTQVGSTCIADFLGQSVDAVIAAIEMGSLFGRLMGDGEEWDCGGRGPSAYDLTDFLAHTAMIMRTQGWLSRTEARKSQSGRAATADIAWLVLTER